MKAQFDFDAENIDGVTTAVSIKSDAHPANSWRHTVGMFPDSASAFDALSQEKLGHREVLWVRFSQEDTDFDYEQINQRFTYYSCRTQNAEAAAMINKYVKGEDYPVVVIEGFPRFMDQYKTVDGLSDEETEAHMWAFRSEVYLCASRATCFLYLICNCEQTPEIVRIQEELNQMMAKVSHPEKEEGGTQTWSFDIRHTAITRKLTDFEDFADTPHPSKTETMAVPPFFRHLPGNLPAVVTDATAIVSSVPVVAPQAAAHAQGSLTEAATAPPIIAPVAPEKITVRRLAKLLGDDNQLKIMVELKSKLGVVTRDQLIDLKDAEEVCARRNFDLHSLLADDPIA